MTLLPENAYPVSLEEKDTYNIHTKETLAQTYGAQGYLRDQAAGKRLPCPFRSSARRSLRSPFERRAPRGRPSRCAPGVASNFREPFEITHPFVKTYLDCFLSNTSATTYTMLVSQEQAHMFLWARTCDKNDLAGEIWYVVHAPCW